jgi:hypothetical protein
VVQALVRWALVAVPERLERPVLLVLRELPPPRLLRRLLPLLRLRLRLKPGWLRLKVPRLSKVPLRLNWLRLALKARLPALAVRWAVLRVLNLLLAPWAKVAELRLVMPRLVGLTLQKNC